MMRKPPLFLAPAPYRRRRLRDAARLLPFAGALLFMLPMLWGREGGGTGPDGLYLFGVWGLLIASAGWLSRRLGDEDPPAGDRGED